MFLPLPKPHGGTPTGNSYLSLWVNCRRKWFYEHLFPHPDGSRGLAVAPGALFLGPRGLAGPGSNRMLGSLLHAYREAWYISGIKDGEDTGDYTHEGALAYLKVYAQSRRGEFSTQEAFDTALAEVTRWGEAFHRHFGPEGHTPLFPQEKVLCLEDGRPAVELELAVPLGHEGYVYTARLDAVTLLQDRYLLGQEHKTAAPSWVGRYIERLPRSSQFTGALFVMRTHPDLKELPWDALQLNYHVKGWTPKSTFASPVQSAKTTRSPEALERFRIRAIGILMQIDYCVHAFQEAMTRGDDFDRTVDALFPDTGEHTGHCYAFNSTCEFLGPCTLGHQGTLGGFRPARSPGEAPAPGPDPLDDEA